jgi:serine protease DegS
MPTTAFVRPALAGLLAAVLVFLVWDALDREPPPRDGEWSYARAVQAAAPAVVNVYSARLVARPDSSDSPLFREFFGDGGATRRRVTTLGSGVVLESDGLIVTNHHVVAEADEIEVSLADGRRLTARLVGSDPETDLAVLRVDASALMVIPSAPAERPVVGDVVLALGNPWGVGQAVTFGIVGATGRDRLGLSTFEDFIQHDAAINPGHSGGALVNPRGELVGINTAMFSRSGGSDGIGFAIPAALVTHVVRQIVEHGAVIRGWLGVDARNLAPGTDTEPRGVRIAGVFRGSPADAAGLRAGDILLAINDQPLADLDDLLQHTTNAAPGASVRLRVLRDGEEFSRETELIQRPTS